jgi:hypothetical protein
MNCFSSLSESSATFNLKNAEETKGEDGSSESSDSTWGPSNSTSSTCSSTWILRSIPLPPSSSSTNSFIKKFGRAYEDLNESYCSNEVCIDVPAFIEYFTIEIDNDVADDESATDYKPDDESTFGDESTAEMDESLSGHVDFGCGEAIVKTVCDNAESEIPGESESNGAPNLSCPEGLLWRSVRTFFRKVSCRESDGNIV